MPIIRQLPVSMINKIAAGEVIERPASVVKELVENSVDAGATRIDISVDKGGIDLIRIVDNGCGIDAEQLPLALSSHATSKIAETDDLFRIRTFGFRGEALASIGEISQMLVRSRTADHTEGAEIRSDGGISSPVGPCGHPVGTSIEIRNLFFNTPVRRKYLRSNQTELGHVTETFLRLVLPHPQVRFTLNHNGRLMYDLPPTSDGIDRVAKLFGKEIAAELIPIESRRGEIGVHGHVCHPNHSRSNNRLQYFFLNKRHIRDRALQHALTEAYRGLLTVGRFPIAFLHVEIPPDQVDVNVHPTKMEVRFLDSNKVYGHFLGAIRERFLNADLKSRPTFERDSQTPTGKSSIGVASGNPGVQVTQRNLTPTTLGTQYGNTSPDIAAMGHANTASDGETPFDRQTIAQGIIDPNDPRMAMAEQTAEQLRQQVLDWASNISKPSLGADDLESDPTESGHSESGHAAMRDDTGYATTGGYRLSRFAGMTEICEKNDRSGNSNHLGNDAGNRPSSRLQLQLHDLNNELQAIAERAPVTDNGRSEHAKYGIVTEAKKTDDSFESVMLSSEALSLEALSLEALSSETLPMVIQVHQRYLVTPTDDGIAIIDQHALHERVLYEKLKLRMTEGTIESQRLLVPRPVDLPPNEAACALENRELFIQLGLLIEPFGGNTILINGYPALFPNIDPVEILQILLEPLLTGGKKPDRIDLLDEMMHQMSCKAAIKAGDKLRPEAMTELLQLARDEINSHHCPHGRPSTLVFTCQELDKMFKRL